MFFLFKFSLDSNCKSRKVERLGQSCNSGQQIINYKYPLMKKVLIIIFAGAWLTIGVGIFIALLFPQLVIAPYINYKFSEASRPEAYTVPKPRNLADTLDTLKGHQQFEYFGLKFKVPWKEKPEKIERETAVILKFSDKKSVAIFDPKSMPPPRELLLKGNPEHVEKVKAFFGGRILDSNYDFYNHILNLSPDQITIFTPKKEASAKSVLVVLKSLLVIAPGGESEIFSFSSNNNIKGFQWGKPDAERIVPITLFDPNDVQYEIVIGGNQEEIDFILSSIEIRR